METEVGVQTGTGVGRYSTEGRCRTVETSSTGRTCGRGTLSGVGSPLSTVLYYEIGEHEDLGPRSSV